MTIDEKDLGLKRDFNGILINIENPAGTFRYGVDPDGHEWRTQFKYDYGFVSAIKGRDGEGVDVYVGPSWESKKVFVVRQSRKESGEYDEDKVMLGFESMEKAKKAYLEHYDSPKFFGGIHEITLDQFKEAVSAGTDKIFRYKKKNVKKSREKKAGLSSLHNAWLRVSGAI